MGEYEEQFLDFKGSWWLPENPKEQRVGTLRHNPDEGGELGLVGDFGNVAFDDRRMKRFNVILGLCEGKEITLYGCNEKGRRMFAGKEKIQSESVYAIGQILVGKHFLKSDEIKFKRLVVSFSHLNEWVGVTGIEIETPKEGIAEWVIKYRHSENIEGATVADFRLFISFGAVLPRFTRILTEASVTQEAAVVIESRDKKHLDEYWGVVRCIQDLLTLGVGNTVHILSMEGDVENDEPIPNRVRLYFAQLGFPRKIESIIGPLMTFTLPQIRDHYDFSTLLRQWLEKREKLQPVLELYSLASWNVPTSLENEFLNLVQAIESYHRRFAGNFEIDPSEHEERKKEILGAVKEEYRDWLRNQLQFSNELSLPKRLHEIVGRYSGTLDRIVTDKEGFVDTVVLTRHYHTHYDENLKSKAAYGQALFRLTHALKLLLEMCLVEEMGFSRDQISDLFRWRANNVATIPSRLD